MGIKGLHGLLKSIQKQCHLKNYSGQTLGVDAYGWLHRGTVACSVDLVLDRPTRKHLDFVLNRVRMLLFFGVTPYLVFDGDNLPSKAGTEQDRHRRRQESKAMGLELQRKGRIPEAYQEFQKAVDVTPHMARQLIEELKEMNVQYVVAPYEADAQLVYLEQQGLIQGIISEDSDLLVFGAKRLLSKLDQHGDCIEINRANFTACREVSLVGWSDADFRRMCILSGCDYLANIPKMGLKTAYRSIRKHRTVEKTLRMLQFENHMQVPADYLANFKQAEHTFLYQRVFCPNAKKVVTLTAPEDGINLDELPFIGADVEAEIAAGVACGDLDPTTKKPIELQPLAAGKLPLGITRRQTLGSSLELKPSKPINSFFTPKRTPLGELDPNSLTPSPSQQRLLERNANNSWQANSAPYRSDQSRSTPFRALSAQGASPMVRSVECNSFLAQAARVSTLQPTKRQRLCSETEDDQLAARPDFRSRFFASHAEQASPSGQKVSRTKKQRKSTLDVFSDEVAEDIFSGIPDPASQADVAETPINSHVAKADDEGGEARPSMLQPRAGSALPEDEGKRLDHSSEDPKLDQAVEYHVQRQNSAILSKYAFQSGPKSSSSIPRPAGTKTPVIQSSNKPALLSSPRTSAVVTQSRVPQRQRLTPLQRMEQTALTRSHTINFPTKLRQADSLKSQTDHETEFASGPSSTSSGIQGSEDLIVPDSDEEVEEDHSISAQTTPLDLKRFSFAAN
ncbi:Exodeoxyribonuclease 1 [Penicillium canariense]|uniref:Exodeoxyribonuclease 1 n=1 Tax=Penicillium canariense TaxID=189055 RepID=A0A9W9HQT0_9EURO|nr:Exodeoxyribonuclease 1 [Penicillium canariense]KAJ5153120.1 Exodeoxyribonuclease 1 [Penicillium canariense]